jgi:hypothetical protein
MGDGASQYFPDREKSTTTTAKAIIISLSGKYVDRMAVLADNFPCREK